MNSNAPMSHSSSPGRKRGKPRWSIPPRPVGAASWQMELFPVPSAGLPCTSATVWVGPPFECKPLGSNIGATSSRLCPLLVMDAPAVCLISEYAEVTAPEISGPSPELLESRVLLPINVVSVAKLVAPALAMPPPRLEPCIWPVPPAFALLDAMVNPSRLTMPPLTKRPPPAESPPLLLANIVFIFLITVGAPAAPPVFALLPKNVLFAKLTLALATNKPPPCEGPPLPPNPVHGVVCVP